MTALALDVRELSFEEVDQVSGAVWWEGVATGLAVVSAGAFLLAAAPVTGGASLVVGAALISGGGHLALGSAVLG